MNLKIKIVIISLQIFIFLANFIVPIISIRISYDLWETIGGIVLSSFLIEKQ